MKDIIKLLIADDDSLIRESLKIILSMDEDFIVLDCVENGAKALKYCLENQIDVALLDIRMPEMNGVEATRQICAATTTKVLILTTFDDDEFIRDAISYGAKGYLLKNNPPDKIKAAIKMVNEGNSVLQDVVMEKLKESLVLERKTGINKELFSQRELEVMELISKGNSNKEIATQLFISEGTVKNYITSILNKTGLEHRTQIAIYYLNGGTK